MYKDGLKESIIFRLSKNIECFWDFTEDLIIDPGIEIGDIQKSLEKKYLELKWSDEGKGIFFGFVPCEFASKVGHRFYVEVWLFTTPCCIRINGGYAVDVMAIAKDLNMVAFDVLGGDRLYPE